MPTLVYHELRQLGNQDEARRWYEKAVEKMGEHATFNEELNRIRAEAAELLSEKQDSEPSSAPKQ